METTNEMIDHDGEGFARPSEAKQNRRSRFKADLAPDMRRWLTRVSRVHAQLCTLVRLYAEPYRAGGQSLLGETYPAIVSCRIWPNELANSPGTDRSRLVPTGHAAASSSRMCLPTYGEGV